MRHDRMQKGQVVPEHRVHRGERGCLCRWVRPVLQVTLDGFQEAVAVFVPEELVQGLDEGVEFVVRQRFFYICMQLLELGDNGDMYG